MAVSHRWKRLIRRWGKGGLIVDRRTRLCSRHFDAHAVAVGEGDPKYFAWNNWGNPVTTPRALPVLRVAQSEKANVFGYVTVNTPSTSSSDQTETVPGVGIEVTVDTCLPKREIGKMVLLDCVEEHSPPSLEHDYMRTSAPKMKTFRTTATQTTLTVEDIEKLEAAASSEPKPGDEFVTAATESDDRVNFYTGISSVSLLNGILSKLKSGAENMKYWRNSGSVDEKVWEGASRPGKKRKLDLFFEFIMTLARLRLNLPLLLLADLFSVSSSKVTEITTTWVCYLHQTLVPAMLI